MLYYAINSNNNAQRTVWVLLENGADPNMKNGKGETPLMAAAVRGNEDIVKLLLEKGADAKARDNDGETAVDKARRKHHSEIVKLLEPPKKAK